MNAYDEFIMSYPTGKWKLEDVLKPDVIIQNVKTTEQISAERFESGVSKVRF